MSNKIDVLMLPTTDKGEHLQQTHANMHKIKPGEDLYTAKIPPEVVKSSSRAPPVNATRLLCTTN